MGCFYATCLLFIFGCLGLVAKLHGFSIWQFVAYIRDELFIVLGTSSSESVLPRMMAKMQKAGAGKSVVGLVIPAGYSFNLDGTSIYLTMAALFIAQATNTPMNLLQQITLLGVLLLTSKGAAGVTGSGFIVLAATLSSVGTVPVAGLALVAWPLADVVAWSPYYSMYLNQLGGGRVNAARFFPHDEVYDLDTREAIEALSRTAPAGAWLAAGNPETVAYYLQKSGRSDIRVVPIYDLNYVPRPGDFILVQDSRRYFETQDLFDFLKQRSSAFREIYSGGVLTSRIYRFGEKPWGLVSQLATRNPLASEPRPLRPVGSLQASLPAQGN
jgi:hypothetical protein